MEARLELRKDALNAKGKDSTECKAPDPKPEIAGLDEARYAKIRY